MIQCSDVEGLVNYFEKTEHVKCVSRLDEERTGIVENFARMEIDSYTWYCVQDYCGDAAKEHYGVNNKIDGYIEEYKLTQNINDLMTQALACRWSEVVRNRQSSIEPIKQGQHEPTRFRDPQLDYD